jgi:hypothetical protein
LRNLAPLHGPESYHYPHVQPYRPSILRQSSQWYGKQLRNRLFSSRLETPFGNCLCALPPPSGNDGQWVLRTLWSCCQRILDNCLKYL